MKFSAKTLLGISISVLLLSACQNAPKDTSVVQEVVVTPMVVERSDSMLATSPKVLSGQLMGGTAIPAYSAEIMPRLIQNTEKYQHLNQNPVKSVVSEPVSTFSVDVDTGSYSNVRRFLNNGGLPPVDAVRAEEFLNYFEYHYPKPTDDKPFATYYDIQNSPWRAGAKILHIGIQGKEMTTKTMPPANLVFLVDVSGSMHGENKLGLVKQTLRTLTEQLRPEDTISIITYANGESLALPATKGTPSNKSQILRVINGLNAGGATAGERAIQLAYQEAQKNYIANGINRILLMTDGDFNVGITDFDTLKGMVAEKRASGVSLSTFGFGTGNYNDMLMEQLADAGDGNYSYIDSQNEIKRVLNRQLTSTLATIAQDVKVQVEFNPATVKEYRLIGYENRVLNQEDFNNDKVDAGDIGAGHSVTALYEIVPVGVAGWLNDSRYQANAGTAATRHADELANVAIRYKLPNQSTSQLISTPIKYPNEPTLNSNRTTLALAVATFADKLKGGKYSGDVSYDDIIRMATSGQGQVLKDEFGLQKEFVELVGIAKSLATEPPSKQDDE